MNYSGQSMWHFCTELSHQWQQVPDDNDLSFYAWSVFKLCSWQSWHGALRVKCLMNAATLSLPAGVSTADKTILGHGANIMLTEWEKARGRERDPSGCLACQIPQLHNSARLAWAPAQPAFHHNGRGSSGEAGDAWGGKELTQPWGCDRSMNGCFEKALCHFRTTKHSSQQCFSHDIDVRYSWLLPVAG